MGTKIHTKIQRVHATNFEMHEITGAGKILRDGGLVAFPTETVYGLGGDALSPFAAEKIYTAKGRPSDNPLIVHIADWKDIFEITRDVPETAKKLADRFWPGPLTMIFNKSEKVPLQTTGGLDTVAVRMPKNLIALSLIRESGVYIAAPSANTSGRPSPTCAEHVIEDLSGKIDMIIDGGTVGIGLESTIVDMTGEFPMILRPGAVTREMLEDVIGEVRVDKTVLRKEPIVNKQDSHCVKNDGISESVEEDFVPKAPGMKYRHYAPKGMLTVVEGDIENVIPRINELVNEKRSDGFVAAVIATEETEGRYDADIVRCIGSRNREGSIAAGLFAVLREMDHLGAQYIYAESFDDDRLGNAIMNRLRKAAGYNIIEADEERRGI